MHCYMYVCIMCCVLEWRDLLHMDSLIWVLFVTAWLTIVQVFSFAGSCCWCQLIATTPSTLPCLHVYTSVEFSHTRRSRLVMSFLMCSRSVFLALKGQSLSCAAPSPIFLLQSHTSHVMQLKSWLPTFQISCSLVW